MNILLDVMGGDNAPDEFIKGAIETINELNEETKITMIGNENIIKEKLKELYDKDDIKEISDRIIIKNATEVITNHESPTEALKNKKDSSMVVGFKMLKDGEGDVFISAGSTGALMAGGLLKVGRIKGIDRPALCTLLPTLDGVGFMLLDLGANTNCKPINLVQFAQMGSIYMSKTNGIDNPPVGLLNIGEEDEKGNELTKEVNKKLREQKDINFYGNIEGRDMFNGDVRVVVTDGFTGNIALKTIEGIAKALGKMLKEELTSSLPRKIGAGILTATGAIGSFKKRIDYSEYGGALLLGIEKPMVKCHGSGKAKDVKIVLHQAENFVNAKVVEAIKETIIDNVVEKKTTVDN
ncbi:MAG: phosphate acyltransferase PlsX [Clostridia bacterium]|nr:phosphate acyltransferase PlsX [Clostridia bacterium]